MDAVQGPILRGAASEESEQLMQPLLPPQQWGAAFLHHFTAQKIPQPEQTVILKPQVPDSLSGVAAVDWYVAAVPSHLVVRAAPSSGLTQVMPCLQFLFKLERKLGGGQHCLAS